MSYEFLNSSMSQAIGSASSTATSESGQRFSALVDSVPLSKDVYVNGPATTDAKGVFVKFLTQFEPQDIPTRAPQSADEVDKNYAGENSTNSLDELKTVFDNTLQVQENIIKTTMMIEMMSTAKQGVTTLFQQQG